MADQIEKNALRLSAGGSLLVGCVAMGFAVITRSQAISLDGMFNLTYFIISLFTMKVARLVVQGDDEHFPAGYSFFEPLINGIKGMFILGISLMAMWGAGGALLTGGRTISPGLAMLYGALATAICWTIALLLRKKTKSCSSPLLKADADGWIVNAAISSAAFIAFIGMWVVGLTPYKSFAPYVDPLLVLLVGGITLSVPVRMAWTALMELLNRAPSAEIRTAVRNCVERELSAIPAEEVTIRVLQPGRVRLVYVHVILQSDADFSIEQMDAVREQVSNALGELHDNTQPDILFTKNRKWGAPLPPASS